MNLNSRDPFLEKQRQQQLPAPHQQCSQSRLSLVVLGFQLALCFGPAQITGGKWVTNSYDRWRRQSALLAKGKGEGDWQAADGRVPLHRKRQHDSFWLLIFVYEMPTARWGSFHWLVWLKFVDAKRKTQSSLYQDWRQTGYASHSRCEWPYEWLPPAHFHVLRSVPKYA